MERASGDYMGMLATVINALAMQNELERRGVATRVQSAISMQSVCEPYIPPARGAASGKGRVVIFGAGPATRSSPPIRRRHCAPRKWAATPYSRRPRSTASTMPTPIGSPERRRFERLSYHDVLARDLQVMDAAAVSLARENRIPILVFSIFESGGFADVVQGKGRFTIVEDIG
jgi:uridylate kinase